MHTVESKLQVKGGVQTELVEVQFDIVKLGFRQDMSLCCVGCFAEHILKEEGNIVHLFLNFLFRILRSTLVWGCNDLGIVK